MPRPGRKESMLEAAVTLFGQKGYHGTTVRDIAAESGMLSGSLYAHIQGKEDLLFQVVERAAERFMAAVEPIAFGPGPASDKLKRAMAAHIGVVADSRDAATVFLQEWKALSPERRAAIGARRDRYEALYAHIIREGVATGEFRPLDERFARLAVLSVLNWLDEWYTPAGPLGPDAIAETFAGLFLEGFGGKGGA